MPALLVTGAFEVMSIYVDFDFYGDAYDLVSLTTPRDVTRFKDTGHVDPGLPLLHASQLLKLKVSLRHHPCSFNLTFTPISHCII